MNTQKHSVTVGNFTGFVPTQGQDGQIYMSETWDMVPDQESHLANNLRRDGGLSVVVTPTGFNVDMGEGDVTRYRVEGESGEAWLKRHQIPYSEESTEMPEDEKSYAVANCKIFECFEENGTDATESSATEIAKEDVLNLINEKNVQSILLLTKGFIVRKGPFNQRTFEVVGADPEDWLRSVLPNITPAFSEEAKVAEDMRASRDAAVVLERANLPLNENTTQGETVKEKQLIWAVGTYNAYQPATDKTERVEKGNDEKEEAKISATYVIKQLTTSMLRDEWRVISEEEASLWIAKSDNAFATLVNRFLTVTSDQGTRRRFKIEGGDPAAWVKENCVVPYEVTVHDAV